MADVFNRVNSLSPSLHSSSAESFGQPLCTNCAGLVQNHLPKHLRQQIPCTLASAPLTGRLRVRLGSLVKTESTRSTAWGDRLSPCAAGVRLAAAAAAAGDGPLIVVGRLKGRVRAGPAAGDEGDRVAGGGLAGRRRGAHQQLRRLVHVVLRRRIPQHSLVFRRGVMDGRGWRLLRVQATTACRDAYGVNLSVQILVSAARLCRI